MQQNCSIYNRSQRYSTFIFSTKPKPFDILYLIIISSLFMRSTIWFRQNHLTDRVSILHSLSFSESVTSLCSSDCETFAPPVQLFFFSNLIIDNSRMPGKFCNRLMHTHAHILQFKWCSGSESLNVIDSRS